MHETLQENVIAVSTDEDDWLEARATGVTASEVHRIASGSKIAWAKILEDKLNGSTFRGNRHTRRGHEREPYLIAAAAAFTRARIRADGELFAAADNERFLATPDGIRDDVTGVQTFFGVEVKSHAFGKDTSKIPADHFDQMQWGMRVLNFDRWLYVTEVMGDDGEPTLEEPTFRWVERDNARILVLESAAAEFLAWRDAGAPLESYDLPDDFEDIVSDWLAANAEVKKVTAVAKAYELKVRKMIAARPGADVDGWKPLSSVGGFNFSVIKKTVLDEEAWSKHEPDSYKEVVDLRERLTAVLTAAEYLYFKQNVSTRLVPQPLKTDK